MLDFLTVGYLADINLLRLQARSFGRYLHEDSIDRIVIINNETEHPDHFERIFVTSIVPEYGALSGKVDLIRYDTLGDFQSVKGYRRQQALKLMGDQVCPSNKFVTLDAKNLLIRPTGAEYFFRADKPIAQPRRLRDHLTAGLRFFDIPESAFPEFILDIYTPVLFQSNLCRNLREEVSRRTGRDFLEFFCNVSKVDDRPLYEFLLYGAYLHAQGGAETFYTFERRPLSLTYMAQKGESPDAFFENVDQGAYKMIGVHRRTQDGDQGQKQRFAEVFLRFGLVSTTEEGLSYLQPAPTLR